MFIPALLTNISTFLSFKINEKSSNELSSRKSTLKNSAPLRESVTSFVPVAITCSLLQRAMKESKKENFLIDGFPRNEDNLQGWLKEVGPDKANVKFILFFECKEETCVERCLKRGAAGSGRPDDNQEALRRRFVTYMNSTMPIVEHYRKQNLVREIDGNQSADDVFAEIKKKCEF